MKMTIVVPDNAVGVDGVFYNTLSLSNVPSNVRILQWVDESGWLEFFDGSPNQQIHILPTWAGGVHQEWVHVDAQNAPVEPPISEVNKMGAAVRLAASDWSVLPDVSDPTKSNPYLGNQPAFIAYRSQLRAMYTNPPSTQAVFPDAPKAVWVTNEA